MEKKRLKKLELAKETLRKQMEEGKLQEVKGGAEAEDTLALDCIK